MYKTWIFMEIPAYAFQPPPKMGENKTVWIL